MLTFLASASLIGGALVLAGCLAFALWFRRRDQLSALELTLAQNSGRPDYPTAGILALIVAQRAEPRIRPGMVARHWSPAAWEPVWGSDVVKRLPFALRGKLVRAMESCPLPWRERTSGWISGWLAADADARMIAAGTDPFCVEGLVSALRYRVASALGVLPKEVRDMGPTEYSSRVVQGLDPLKGCHIGIPWAACEIEGGANSYVACNFPPEQPEEHLTHRYEREQAALWQARAASSDGTAETATVVLQPEDADEPDE